MYSPQLINIVQDAIMTIRQEMTGMAPYMAAAVDGWLNHLARTPNPEDYYLHPKAFPLLLLPWWMEESFQPLPMKPFQSAVAYSSINGYYYTRLIDNIMDGDGRQERPLLPAAHFFLVQSQLAYFPYFPAGHPFWNFFLTTLVRAGETAMRDAATADIDLATFKAISAQKVCGAKIPLAAVAHRYGRTHLIAPWSALVDRFGSWHQMTDDLFDWHKDLQAGNPTYILSEGKRQAGDAAVADWIVSEGFDWGCGQLETWLLELRETAYQLQSPPLMAYLKLREELFQKQKLEARQGLKSLAKLISIIR